MGYLTLACSEPFSNVGGYLPKARNRCKTKMAALDVVHGWGVQGLSLERLGQHPRAISIQ